MNCKSILFLPVSGPKGSGEFIRCVTIAQGIKNKWENIQIKFVLNRNAVYSKNPPFESHFLDRSPTLDVKNVKKIIETEKPDLCIFDNSGRTSIFRMLKRKGIPIVFISSRKKPRNKAFSPKWLPFITQHWIAQPTFAQGPLTRWEWFKVKITGSNPPYFFETLFPAPNDSKRERLKEKIGLNGAPYIVFCSGGGGDRNIDGKKAPEVFANAAGIVAEKTGIQCVALMGPNYSGRIPEFDGVVSIRSIANDAFIDLIHDAKMLAIGGGSSIAQGLVNRRVSVVAPAARDQQLRIDMTDKLGVIKSVPLDVIEISRSVIELCQDAELFQEYQKKVNQLNIKNGLPEALKAVSLLIG